jgi:hypothetical protein
MTMTRTYSLNNSDMFSFWIAPAKEAYGLTYTGRSPVADARLLEYPYTLRQGV